MSFDFTTLPVFEKELKRLSKKYKSLKGDLIDLQDQIEKNPELGIDLGDGFKKIRLKISSKGKGKSGGGRVVTKNIIISKSNQKINFVFLWDKSEMENVDTSILKKLL